MQDNFYSLKRKARKAATGDLMKLDLDGHGPTVEGFITNYLVRHEEVKKQEELKRKRKEERRQEWKRQERERKDAEEKARLDGIEAINRAKDKAREKRKREKRT